VSSDHPSRPRPFTVAVASGKGGTGKTTVAVNLAWTAARRKGRRTAYADADTEAPNGHLFLKPQIRQSRPFQTFLPEVDSDKCTLCGACGDFCRFGAIAVLGEKLTVFPDLCHACGGCILVCPVEALSEKPIELGVIETGEAGPIDFVQGRLHVGESHPAPLVRAVAEALPPVDIAVLDAAPGTSCPMVEAVSAADFVLLVAEPTPFGLSDFKLAVEAVESLRKPFGVVINRSGLGLDREIEEICARRAAPVLLRIPNERRIAEAYAEGRLLAEAMPEYRRRMEELLGKLLSYAPRTRHS